jgi:hypothetical protein
MDKLSKKQAMNFGIVNILNNEQIILPNEWIIW